MSGPQDLLGKRRKTNLVVLFCFLLSRHTMFLFVGASPKGSALGRTGMIRCRCKVSV